MKIVVWFSFTIYLLNSFEGFLCFQVSEDELSEQDISDISNDTGGDGDNDEDMDREGCSCVL